MTTQVHGWRGTARTARGAGIVAALALAGAGLVGTAHVAAAATGPEVCASASPDLSSYDSALPGSTTVPTDWVAANGVDYGFTRDGVRVSNATAGNVYLRAARLATPASESTPDCDGFTASFTVAAADGEYQEGLTSSVALGGTSRYGGVVGLRHVGGKLQVYTIWVPADATDAEVPSWRSAVVAALDPGVPHTVTATAYLVPGRADDVMQITVDGTLVDQGVFTWETYAGLDPSQAQPHDVDTLLFRAWTSSPTADGVGYDTAPAVPDLAGKGFVFSDIRYSSFDGTAPTPAPLTPCANPTTTTVDEQSGLLDTATDTRTLGGSAFTDDGLHVWTTGTADAPAVPTSESKSAGYVDVDVPLTHAAPASIDLSVASGSAPGINLVLDDGRILVHEDVFGQDSWWSRTPTPGLPSGIHPSYQRAFGTLAEWAGALPAATVDHVGYSLGSGAIGDATIRSLTLGCTRYSFLPAAATPTASPEPTASPTATPTEQPSTGVTPPPDSGHADSLGTTTDSLLAALRQLGVTPRTPAALGVTISSDRGAVTGPVDSSARVDVVVPWTADDTWVDVYLYSTRTYVGTFPIVDGAVRLTDLDLSALAAGTHHLVLVGQESGAVTAVQLQVTTPALANTGGTGSLANTGAADVGPLALVAVLLAAAGGVLVLARHRALDAEPAPRRGYRPGR